MVKKIAIYTSNRAISLQTVSRHIGSVLKKALKADISYFFGPYIDTEYVESHDAGIIVMPFDMIWCLQYFYIAWKYWYQSKIYAFYTTIEGDVDRETIRFWIIRDLEFIANSDYTKTKLEKVGARVREVVHHGVDVQKILQCSEKGRHLRESLGLDDKFVVGYIASGHKRKCHNLFSRVVKILEEKDNSIKFIVLTDSEGKTYYRDTKAIVFDSFGEMDEEDVYSIYHAVDVYVQGSCIEGFGLPVAEAIASGRIVVIPDYKPLTEFTPSDLCVKVPVYKTVKVDSGGGIIYELKIYSPEDMASKILEAREKIAKRDFSEDSFEEFRRNYSIESRYQFFVDLLSQR